MNKLLSINLMKARSQVLLSNFKIKYSCSTSLPPTTNNTNKILTDYEYIAKIRQNLMQKNVNQALRYLIKSNLDSKILDMHIFRFFYQKVNELKLDLSYQQIAYKLYRQNFKPNILILDWMTSLARSTNDKIIKLIQDDFKLIKIQMPKVQRIFDQDNNLTNNAKTDQSHQKQKSRVQNNKKLGNSVTQHKAHHITVPQAKQSNIQPHLGQPSQSLYPSQQFQPITKNTKIDQLLILNKLIQTFIEKKPKITLHNIEVTYGNLQDDNLQQYEEIDQHNLNDTNVEVQEQADSDMDEDEQGIMSDKYIKKIKIGRIQIQNNSVSESTAGSNMDINDGTTANRKSGLEDKDKDNKDKKDN